MKIIADLNGLVFSRGPLINCLYCLGLILFVTIGQASALAGPEPDFVLVAPETSIQKPVISGRSVRMMVVFTNSDSKPKSIPARLDLRIEGEAGISEVIAFPESGPGSISANGFLKLSYAFDLPVSCTGALSAAHIKGRGNRVLFYAAAPDPKVQETGTQASEITRSPARESAPQTEDGTESDSDTDTMLRFQPFFVNFSPYKPVYFLFGADPGIQKTSFQISFKYKLFNFKEESFLKTHMKPVENIYLAYTQQSFWDLKSDSAPFEDSRYMPEIFYFKKDLGFDLPYLFASGLQTGFQHESNGRDGNESRSTNYGYIQPFWAFKFNKSLHMKLAPKAWIYIRNDNDTNPDLPDYRGYFDIETKIGDPKGLALTNHFRHGKKGASWQFDLSYPLNQLPWLKGLLDMYIHAQYYSGYSENLLQYDVREDIFRLGFSLVR